MKRKIGRLMAMLLALVVVFALVSCGDSTTEEAQDEEVEEEPEQEEEEAEDEAIGIGLGDTIETDKFTMRFDPVEFYDDGTVCIRENETMTTSLAEGYKRIVLKTHFESFASSSITLPTMTFNVSLLINGEYAYDSDSTDILIPLRKMIFTSMQMSLRRP